MKIVVAPDSFKGSADSLAVAMSIKRGILQVFEGADVVAVPVADGGEGTVDSILYAAGGEKEDVPVLGPLGEERTASYGIVGDTAVIEMASASGLPLVPPEKRNPLVTTTYGTGQLIKAGLDKGLRRFVIGIGGSATTDGGAGLAQALGVSFQDKDGKELPFGGGALKDLKTIDVSGLDPRVKDSEFTVASDVTNPLFGKTGSAHVYGPQKGATPAMVEDLDKALILLSEAVKDQLGIDAAEIPGAGAAGGLGYSLLVFLGAHLKSGIETILNTVKFQEIVNGADLVITGEGKIDGQSVYGKVPVGVAAFARKAGVPVLALVGDIGKEADKVYDYGIDALMSNVNKAMPLEDAMASSLALTEDAAMRAMRMIRIGRSLKGE